MGLLSLHNPMRVLLGVYMNGFDIAWVQAHKHLRLLRSQMCIHILISCFCPVTSFSIHYCIIIPRSLSSIHIALDVLLLSYPVLNRRQSPCFHCSQGFLLMLWEFFLATVTLGLLIQGLDFCKAAFVTMAVVKCTIQINMD